MKRVITVGLSALLVFALVGCSSTVIMETEKAYDSIALSAEVPTIYDDGSFMVDVTIASNTDSRKVGISAMTNANSSVSSFYHNLSHLKWPINNKQTSFLYPVYWSKSSPVNSQDDSLDIESR